MSKICSSSSSDVEIEEDFGNVIEEINMQQTEGEATS